MAAGEGVLAQLSEASSASSDEQDSDVDDHDTVSLISSTSGTSKTTSLSECHGESRSTSATDNALKRAPSSLLSVLQQAKTSDLSRKRAIRNNPPKGKKRKVSTGTGSSASTSMKSVTPRDRCNRFPKEYLTVSGGKLFCGCCREEVSMKLSSIKHHIDSNKHKVNKEKEAKRVCGDKTLAQQLQAYESETHPRGETLSESHKLYRIKVVTAFLKSGIPLQKVGGLKEVLEIGGYRLTDERGMRDLIPFVRTNEGNKIKEELSGKFVSIIFDGTTRLGEAFAIVLRFILADKIVQRLVKLQILAKPMNGEELAREVISILQVTYGVKSDQLLACMHDRASVNGAAMRTINVVFPSLVDIGCYSHTIDLAGDKFDVPVLDEFFRLWVSLFAHSSRAKVDWRTTTGISIKSHSCTRWWSKWEVLHQVFKYFGDIVSFLRNTEASPATTVKLLQLFSDRQKHEYLQLELAVVIDAGEPFVKATYSLEGDGALAFKCYEIYTKLLSAIELQHYPNLSAVAKRLTGSVHSLLDRFMKYGKDRVTPVVKYFKSKFSNELSKSLSIFKAAQVFAPSKVKEVAPDVSIVNSLSEITFLNNKTTLDNLKSELPQYIAVSADTSPEVDVMSWWAEHSQELPHWSSAAMMVALIQPSSGAVERVFSILTNTFNAQQESSLQDYIEASLMLQYNY